MSNGAHHDPPRSERPPYAPAHRRLLRAITELAGVQDGPALTPDLVAERAGVPPETFYEFFSDLDSSVVAAHDAWVDRGARRLERPVRGAPAGSADDAEAISAVLDDLIGSLFDCLAERPEVARLCLIETPSTGPRGLAARDRAIDRLRSALDTRLLLVGRWPSEEEGVVSRMVAGGVYDTAQRYTTLGRLDDLPRLVPTIAGVWAAVLAPRF